MKCYNIRSLLSETKATKQTFHHTFSHHMWTEQKLGWSQPCLAFRTTNTQSRLVLFPARETVAADERRLNELAAPELAHRITRETQVQRSQAAARREQQEHKHWYWVNTAEALSVGKKSPSPSRPGARRSHSAEHTTRWLSERLVSHFNVTTTP